MTDKERIAFLEKALEQAVAVGGLEDSQGDTVFTYGDQYYCFNHNAPELAQYLKEKENGTSNVS